MIKSIFYSRFHPEKGPAILYQVPSGSISLSSNPPVKRQPQSQGNDQTHGPRDEVQTSEHPATSVPQPLLSFPALSDYLIPRQEFCNELVSICVDDLRVIGYPVCIVDRARYARNEFIFNFAIVVGVDAEVGLWHGIVKRIASLLREMEEGSGFLTADEEEEHEELEDTGRDEGKEGNRAAARAGGKVYALCEMILEDLNNYCECMIPLDSANTLNLKLFPTYPTPPPIRTWHVPLLTVHLPTLMDPTWDLTMQRITPHINGVNSVARIAHLADADVRLVCEAVRHLKYYGCCLLLDIFQFAAMYAVTPLFPEFVIDAEMQKECARYVSVPGVVSSAVGGTAGGNAGAVASGEEDEVKRDVVVRLYSGLRQGVTLKMWCLENREMLGAIDVRRLITFGVIKGFLYRTHKYAVSLPRIGGGRRVAKGHAPSNQSMAQDYDKNERPQSIKTTRGGEDDLEEQLSRYLDGLHCFNEICTELQIGDKALLSRLKAQGDVQIIHR